MLPVLSLIKRAHQMSVRLVRTSRTLQIVHVTSGEGERFLIDLIRQEGMWGLFHFLPAVSVPPSFDRHQQEDYHAHYRRNN